MILSPLELIEKLAALVHSSFAVNLVRYHGVLAAHAKGRDKIVPKKPDAMKLREERGASRNCLPWAALLARVLTANDERTCSSTRLYLCSFVDLVHFALHSYSNGFSIDVTKCPKCGGRLRLVAAITDAASAKRYLDHAGLPSEVPALAPARAPPQTELDFDW